jgi:hypothetical protein
VLTSAAVFLSASLLVEVAAAQPLSSDAAKAMLGNWEISNPDRDRICFVMFRPEPAPGGLKLEFDKACAATFPLTKGVAAWTIGADALRLVDAKGKTVFELMEVENGMFQGERSEEGLYFMQRPGAINPDASTPEIFPVD